MNVQLSFRENKHMKVSYNEKITMKRYLFNEIRDTKRSLFWLLTGDWEFRKSCPKQLAITYVVA